MRRSVYGNELPVLCLPAELGDFEEEEHTPAYISEFRFMPNQTEAMEVDIYNKYKSLRFVLTLFNYSYSVLLLIVAKERVTV